MIDPVVVKCCIIEGNYFHFSSLYDQSMQTTYMLQKCDRSSLNAHGWLQSTRLKTHVNWEDEVALLLYTEINVRVQKI